MDFIAPTSLLLRLLPPGAGQRKIARRIHDKWLHGSDGLRVTRLAGGARFELLLGDHAQGETALTRRYEPELISFISKRLGRGGVLFDVGGHIGMVSLTVARNPRVHVHAFEPNPDNARRFRRHISINPTAHVTLTQAAVGETVGEVTFSDPIPGQSGLGHISDTGFTVPQVTLDDYTERHGIERIDVLKVDVEGFECHVLRGAERLLKEGRISVIVAEVHDGFLQRAGDSRDALMGLLSNFTPRSLPPVGMHRVRPAEEVDYDNFAFVRGPLPARVLV